MSANEFVYETCKACGKNLCQVEDIYVDIETDDYLCLDCAVENGVHYAEVL